MDRRDVVRAFALGMTAPILGLGRTLERIDRIGIQLYTVRGLLARDFEGTLAALRAIGFQEVEFAGYPRGASAPAVAAMLTRTGLAAPSAHIGLRELRDEWERTLEFADLVGHRYLALASVPPADRASADGYRRLAGLLNRTGERARAVGIQLAYHNHDFEFTPMDGVVPYDLLTEETDPGLVQLELDLYWTTRAGRDPVKAFARWPGRFPLLHLKDMDQTPERSFTELGRGQIDFGRILSRSKAAGARHFFYEQDRTPGSPLESARVSYAYLAALRF